METIRKPPMNKPQQRYQKKRQLEKETLNDLMLLTATALEENDALKKRIAELEKGGK